METEENVAVEEQDQQKSEGFALGAGGTAAAAADDKDKGSKAEGEGAAAEAGADKTDEEKAAEQKAADDAAAAAQKKAEEDAAKAKGADAGKETAAQRLEARAAGKGAEAGAVQTDEEKAAEQKAADDAAAAAQKKADEDAAKAKGEGKDGLKLEVPTTVEDLLKLPGVGDATIKMGDKDVTLSDYAKEFPEQVQSAAIIGQAMLQTALQALVKSGQVVTADAMSEMQAEVEHFRFMTSVSSGFTNAKGEVVKGHADVLTVVLSPEYKEWLGKQNKVIQGMHASGDPEDAVAILDAFKEHAAAAANTKTTEAQKKAKEKKDGVHRETVRGDKAQPAAGATTPKDEFSDGFKLGKVK